MKFDGLCYNIMISSGEVCMLIEEKILMVFFWLSFLYFYDFGILINFCCIIDFGNICLMKEFIFLFFVGGLYICC